jgi:hypothetical protein
MRVLFDQGTPVAIKKFLKGHDVRTAREQAWSTLLNGELLRAAEEAHFDVLLTTDNHIVHQQNLTGRNLAIVVLSKNRWRLILQNIAQVISAVDAASPGTYTIVHL